MVSVARWTSHIMSVSICFRLESFKPLFLGRAFFTYMIHVEERLFSTSHQTPQLNSVELFCLLLFYFNSYELFNNRQSL